MQSPVYAPGNFTYASTQGAWGSFTITWGGQTRVISKRFIAPSEDVGSQDWLEVVGGYTFRLRVGISLQDWSKGYAQVFCQ